MINHVTHFDTSHKQIVSYIETDTPSALRQNYGMRNKWLSDRIKELDKTQTALATELHLGRARVTDMVVGRRAILAAEVPIIARFLEWPESTVLRHISAARGDDAFTPNVVPVDMQVVPVTVIGEVQAGVWRESNLLPPDEQFQIYAMADPRFKGIPLFALRVRGPSMNRVYPDGTFVVCAPLIHSGGEIPIENGHKVVVQRRNADGEVEETIKELVYDKDRKPWLWPRSDHPEFQTPWLLPNGDDWHGLDDAEDIRVSALVVFSVRPEA